MRCLFKHKWVMGEILNVRFFHPHRTCERCGTMQRGVYDSSWRNIYWETMRERTYNKSEQAHIVRSPSSRIDQFAHTLGLRRSRENDRRRPIKGSAFT